CRGSTIDSKGAAVTTQTLTDAETRFRPALGEIEYIVGASHLVYQGDDLERRSRDIIPRTNEAVAFASPGSVEEVVALVKLANRHSLPLWPCSKGKNWGYGAATPARSGALVLVLERLNRIVTVNTEMAYAVVEPGVTYRQLHEY